MRSISPSGHISGRRWAVSPIASRGGRFSLDGRQYQTTLDDKQNALHGGVKGFDQVKWEVRDVKSGPTASVSTRHVRRDGEEGYPGEMTAGATYSPDEKNQLTIEYPATPPTSRSCSVVATTIIG